MLINGVHSENISVQDRGLLYGDGVFETILCQQGRPVLFAEHMQRFERGCERLSLPAQDIQIIQEEITTVADGQDCIVKLLLTRGARGRGYYYDVQDHTHSRILYKTSYAAVDQDIYKNGAKLTICAHRLVRNATLAGIKHLNRLDQVIARSEWSTEFNEGIVLDSQGLVIEGTMSNVFALVDDVWVTPKMDQCGVQGVLRDFLLQQAVKIAVDVKEKNITLQEALSARAMFVCNSVVGIWPVQSIDGTTFPIHGQTRTLMEYIHHNVSTLYPI